MLKTNSKKAIENIKLYVLNNYTPDEEPKTPPTFVDVSKIVLADVKRVKGYEVKRFRYSWQEAFADWAAGLPGILDTCYYYNRSAVDDLGKILEETDEEKAKYTEEQAEKLLSYLIYREMTKAAKGILF